MTIIRGRGGRIITIDENQAGPLAAALANLPHTRELDATQPMEPVVLPTLTRTQRFDEWVDRFLDGFDSTGLYVAGAVVGGLLLGLLAVGVFR